MTMTGVRIFDEVWRDDAACREVGPYFHDTPDSDRNSGQAVQNVITAKAICAGCTVRTRCLAWAMGYEAGHARAMRQGVWGGLTTSERAAADLAARRVVADGVIA